jgi:hypothetical protein
MHDGAVAAINQGLPEIVWRETPVARGSCAHASRPVQENPFQAAELLVEQIVGLVNQADENVGHEMKPEVQLVLSGVCQPEQFALIL